MSQADRYTKAAEDGELLSIFQSSMSHLLQVLTGVKTIFIPLNLTLPGEYAGTQGLGLLRLHSTYRHDLKIYASDEGRVQMTAAAFAKGLLALEVMPLHVRMMMHLYKCNPRGR